MKTTDKGDFCACTTIQIGTYVESGDPQSEITTARHFVKAFALWLDVDFFSERDNWLILSISYPNHHFFKEELLSAIKFFMQYHDYTFIESLQSTKPADIDEE